MLSAALVDTGFMLFSALLNSGASTALFIMGVTGVIPLLAIAAVCAIDGAVIRTRSVWSDIKKDDGLRLLVTRFRGRGLPTSQYDVWMPSLGPSEALLTAVQSGAIDWKAFGKKYREELFLDGPIDDRSKTIKNHGQKSTLRLLKALGERQNVTLMCHCGEDATECHRFLLEKAIAKA